MSGEGHRDTWERRDEAEQKVEELEQENAELRERVRRLQRVVDLTESFLGAVAQGYPDWENEIRAERVVDAIAALSQANAQAKPGNQEE